MGAARAAVWAAALLLAAVRVRSACLAAAELAVRCAPVVSASTDALFCPHAGSSPITQAAPGPAPTPALTPCAALTFVPDSRLHVYRLCTHHDIYLPCCLAFPTR